MSIVLLVKVTLYGLSAGKDAVLDGLQRLGCLHPNDLRSGAAKATNVAAPSADARAALQSLQDSPVRRRPLRQKADVDLQAPVKEALDIRDRSRRLYEEHK